MSNKSPALQEAPEEHGIIFDIKRFAAEDGPGIRTTVFLKGCPLDCLWCQSPESRGFEPELIFVGKRCAGCGRCVDVCAQGVHSFIKGDHLLDRRRCVACGKCSEICLEDALEIKGRAVTVDELTREIRKDISFFLNTGGGVTFSGGEPTAQPAFLINLLRACKGEGIPTALDTCGFVEWDILSRMLDVVDLFLFDIKHMDPARHRKLTGKSNDVILDNLKRLNAIGKLMEIRVPLIPRVNDSEQHLSQLFNYIHSTGINKVTLLPFNEASGSKYSWCGKRFPLAHLKMQSEEGLKNMVNLGTRVGIEVKVQT